MAYAELSDVKKRCRRTLSTDEETYCEVALDDAALIIDQYNDRASEDAKLVVSCNMIIRALGDGDDSAQVPIGATQGTMSALGYSQTWGLPSGGSVGELYLSKLDKKLLGVSGKLVSKSPLEARYGN